MKMKRQLKLTIFWFSRRAEGNFQKEKKHPAQEKTADKKQRARGVMGKKFECFLLTRSDPVFDVYKNDYASY